MIAGSLARLYVLREGKLLSTNLDFSSPRTIVDQAKGTNIDFHNKNKKIYWINPEKKSVSIFVNSLYTFKIILDKSRKERYKYFFVNI